MFLHSSCIEWSVTYKVEILFREKIITLVQVQLIQTGSEFLFFFIFVSWAFRDYNFFLVNVVYSFCNLFRFFSYPPLGTVGRIVPFWFTTYEGGPISTYPPKEKKTIIKHN